MELHRLGHDIVHHQATWMNGNVCRPIFPRAYQSHGGPEPRRGRWGRDQWDVEKATKNLRNRDLDDRAGDLGWTLDYATAWCFRHIHSSRPEVADVIDNVREFEGVTKETPYLVFDYLDRALFAGKLQNMVHLRWRSHASCTAGTTYAPGFNGKRICIELNSTPFQEDGGDIDELLDSLIHQMIHAYFLVCCGAQKKSAKQDGRMADGLHFGVILSAIRDVTKICRDDQLPLIFHSTMRRKMKGYAGSAPNRLRHPMLPGIRSAAVEPYISLDPKGPGAGPMPGDGQTHCMRDNRSVSHHDVKNWQAIDYQRALDLDMEARGDEIWDFDGKGKMDKEHRLKGPPSSSYAELVWGSKRIMVDRENALKYSSIEGDLKKNQKFELKIPKCELAIIHCVHQFLQKGEYTPDSIHGTRGLEEAFKGRPRIRSMKGPPVLLRTDMSEDQDMLKHIKVFKVAEKIDFDELMQYSLKRLWSLPWTRDDPIAALKEVYDLRDGKVGTSVHHDLHTWVRHFFQRTESDSPGDSFRPLANHFPNQIRPHHPSHVTTEENNLQKILRTRGEDFWALITRSPALADDYRLSHGHSTGLAQHLHHQPWPAEYAGGLWPLSASSSTSSLSSTLDHLDQRRHLLPRADSLEALRLPATLGLPLCLPLGVPRLLHNAAAQRDDGAFPHGLNRARLHRRVHALDDLALLPGGGGGLGRPAALPWRGLSPLLVRGL